MQGFNMLRKMVLGTLDVALDRQTCIDSLPVPVVQFYYAPDAASEWKINGAGFGRIASKKQVIYGYKLQLLVTLGGVILDFEMAPANFTDLQVGQELLQEHQDIAAVADKGYVSQPVAEQLLAG
ncbi:MAG TPA: transposase, partial [Chloroflexia bacterium]